MGKMNVCNVHMKNIIWRLVCIIQYMIDVLLNALHFCPVG